MMITMQQRTMTMTDPREAKEMDLPVRRTAEAYRRLRIKHRGISIKR